MSVRCLVLAICLVPTIALADDPAWVRAQQVARATGSDVMKSGKLLDIAPHVPDLEKALADGAAEPAPAPDAQGRIIVLTDGPTETIAALAEAAAKKQSVVAMPNAYADATLFLALYYNEAHRYDDALRVIDQGLKLAYTQTLGAHLPKLFSERADAYGQTRHFDQALASCDAGLALPADQDSDRARFERCRGFDLTELKRLDEAEAAYNQSLKFEPNNPLALQELAYIARLKAGAPPAAIEQMTRPATPQQPQPQQNGAGQQQG